MAKLKLAGACLNQIPFDWDNNLSNIFSAIDAAKSENVDLLLLPELCITGYGCEDMFLSEWLPGKALAKLSEIIPETANISVVVGLPVLLEEKVYNVACFISDQKILGFYAKHHLANDGVHYEPRWFTSWPKEKVIKFDYEGQSYDFGAIILDHKDIRIGFEICEDAWRKDRPAHELLEKEVQLILNPSASHFAFHKAAFRENLVVSSSKDFNCVYLYTNLLGNESGRMIFDGDIIISQKGKLLGLNKRLSYKDCNILALNIDFDNPESSQVKITEKVYEPIREFAIAASLGLFDYMRKSRSKGFILSLSGGADSSSIATLVAESVSNGIDELGLENYLRKAGLDSEVTVGEDDVKKTVVNHLLTTAYQGTENSSEETTASARNLAKSIGAKFYHWTIDKIVDQYTSTIEKNIGRELTWERDDITLQNIQARSRSPIIWMLANIDNKLLLSTSNRSEGDVGYATMDGDTSGSISPIAAVDKHFILQWLHYAEKELGYDGLSYVNNLQPSAELRPLEMNQTDEDDLMPYEVIVEIEELAIRDRKSPVETFRILLERQLEPKEILKRHITKFFRLWSRNQWKRERLAPSFHLDAFNVDPRTWCRFPILSSGFSEELKELEKL
ncbi:MAG: NAD(+) synthase [Cyclobacteriaceae bacterium]